MILCYNLKSWMSIEHIPYSYRVIIKMLAMIFISVVTNTKYITI